MEKQHHAPSRATDYETKYPSFCLYRRHAVLSAVCAPRSALRHGAWGTVFVPLYFPHKLLDGA
jgi:hypothetical protein